MIPTTERSSNITEYDSTRIVADIYIGFIHVEHAGILQVEYCFRTFFEGFKFGNAVHHELVLYCHLACCRRSRFCLGGDGASSCFHTCQFSVLVDSSHRGVARGPCDFFLYIARVVGDGEVAVHPHSYCYCLVNSDALEHVCIFYIEVYHATCLTYILQSPLRSTVAPRQEISR